jgi:hypothetical protein
MTKYGPIDIKTSLSACIVTSYKDRWIGTYYIGLIMPMF